MPFERPTLAELQDDLIAGIDSRLDETDARVRRSFLGILARVLAGGLHMLYGFLAWIARQAFPDTAEDEHLERWAAIWGIEKAPPVKATGTVTITGTPGTTVEAGTVFRSSAGQDYQATTEEDVGAGGTVDIAIEAVLAGTAGNAAGQTRLGLVSPIAGIQTAATASGAIEGGANEESNDSLRARLLKRIRTTPRGGTAADYEVWGLGGHADVTRVWARPLAGGLGTVTVYLMTDDATDNGIPTAAVVDAVQDYIDARRPVTAAVTVAAPAGVALDVSIKNVEPDTQAVMDAIKAELADLVRRESEPGGTILVSHIREAISTAAGETDHALTSPVADVDHGDDQIAVLGDVTFTTG